MMEYFKTDLLTQGLRERIGLDLPEQVIDPESKKVLKEQLKRLGQRDVMKMETPQVLFLDSLLDSLLVVAPCEDVDFMKPASFPDQIPAENCLPGKRALGRQGMASIRGNQDFQRT